MRVVIMKRGGALVQVLWPNYPQVHTQTDEYDP